MNFEVWPQKRMIAPTSKPHHKPRIQNQQRALGIVASVSRLPPMNSQIALIDSKVFMRHPRNNRLKKKVAVCRFMQKKAQPRFTMTKVNAQPAILPANDGGRGFFCLH